MSWSFTILLLCEPPPPTSHKALYLYLVQILLPDSALLESDSRKGNVVEVFMTTLVLVQIYHTKGQNEDINEVVLVQLR